MIAKVDVPQNEMSLHFHPQYYYLGHFSKFIAPGSSRIDTSVSGNQKMSDCSWPYGGCDADRLHVTSWLSSDEAAISIIALNCGTDDKDMSLSVSGKSGVLKNVVPANSIQTYIINL